MQHTGMCVATITHPGGNGKRCVLEYKVDGERFAAFGPRLRYLTVGEHFQLLYNKQKPWKHKLLTDKQVFLKSEQTALIQGKILRCINGAFTQVIFAYCVNGKNYKKKQLIAGPAGLRKNDQCTVQFSLDKPERSMLIGGYVQINKDLDTPNAMLEKEY